MAEAAHALPTREVSFGYVGLVRDVEWMVLMPLNCCENRHWGQHYCCCCNDDDDCLEIGAVAGC